jgi:hypothetical protein
MTYLVLDIDDGIQCQIGKISESQILVGVDGLARPP